MLILDDSNKPIVLDNVHGTTPTNYMWVLDLNMMDYTLAPLNVLEEIVSPSLKIRVRGFDFFLPAMWNLLVYSEDTYQLDVVEVSELAGREFTAFVYDISNPNIVKYRPGIVTVSEYSPEHTSVAPVLNKNQMLCHPISPVEWVNVTPSDSFNKYLKELVVGDIIG